MHNDLRRQALESGKTVSRKARSRQASRANSRANSPAPDTSRVASKLTTPAGSDDGYSDQSSLGIASGNVSSDDELPVIAPQDGIQTIVDNLLDKSTKRQNAQARIDNLTSYVNCKIALRPDEEKDNREAELVVALLKFIKTERSEEETLLSLHALSLTCLGSIVFASSAAGNVYNDVESALKRTIDNSLSLNVKAAAIHALSTFAFYGGVSNDEISALLAYFLEIVSSDGAFIEALDAPIPVQAAIQEYGFLLTRHDEYEEESNEAVEIFLDQLNSSDPGVQIAAGEAIALLYELSYSPLRDDEEPPEEDDEDEDPDRDYKTEGYGKLIKRYDAFRRRDEVETQLETLTRATFHSLSQKKKRALHTNMSDILDSIRNPTHGPRYQNALDISNHAIGSTMKITVAGGKRGRGSTIFIDSWWKLLRYQHLIRVLKGGFSQHYIDNQLVTESLPSETAYDSDDDALPMRHYARSARMKKPAMNPYVNDPWEQ